MFNNGVIWGEHYNSMIYFFNIIYFFEDSSSIQGGTNSPKVKCRRIGVNTNKFTFNHIRYPKSKRAAWNKIYSKKDKNIMIGRQIK